MTISLVQAAHVYARQGWRVFPCEPRGKKPLVKWRDLATTDAGIIDTWWRATPDANIGLVTGEHFTVIDLDNESARDVFAAWCEERGIDWRAYPRVKTGHGWHVYVAANGERNSAGLRPHIDVRGVGGYVLAPPSMHPNGSPYRWTQTPNGTIPALDVAAFLPRPVRAASQPARAAPTAASEGSESAAWADAALTGELGKLAMQTEPGRNDALNRAAFNLGQIVAGGALDINVVRAHLERIAAQIGLVEDDGPDQVRKTIESGLSKGMLEPRAPDPPSPRLRTRRARAVQPVEEDEEPDVQTPTPTFPFAALPLALRRLCEAADNADVYNPEFTAVYGLPVLAACIGAKWVYNPQPGWSAYARLWCGVVSRVGTAKSPALRHVLEPLRDVESKWYDEWREEMEDYQEQLDIARSESRKAASPKPTPRRLLVDDYTLEILANLLQENSQGLLHSADELSAVIAGLGQYKGGKGTDRAKLLSLFDGAPLSIDRKGTDPKNPIHTRVAHPMLNIVGGIQPGVLSRMDGEDGMPARFLLAYPKPRHRIAKTIGVDDGARYDWAALVHKLLNARPDTLTVMGGTTETPEAWRVAHQHYIDVGYDMSNPTRVQEFAGKLPNHCANMALVLAVARHIGEGGMDRVTARDMHNARAICDYFLAHVRTLPFATQSSVASLGTQSVDRGVDEIIVWLRENDGKGSLRDLRRARVGGVKTAAEASKLAARYEERHPGCVWEVANPKGEPSVMLRSPS